MACLGFAGAVAVSLFDELVATFGSNALADALFYQHSPALRFELSGGTTHIAQFLQAIDRARAILDVAFADAEELTVILRVWNDETPGHLWQRETLWRKVEASLLALEITPPVPEYRVQHIEGNDFPDHSFAFQLSRNHLPELLFGSFARELGLTPRLDARLTLAAPELGVLACPYDDRGMDLLGPDTARLAQLYTDFNGWLLDYDRMRMETMFGHRFS